MKVLKERIVKIFATGFGLGYAPVAPGTFGTLLGIPLFYCLHQRGPIPYLLFTLLFVVIAILVSELASQYYVPLDSPHIVIDEVAGYLVTMAWLPRTWPFMVAGFALFRVLDATKPGLIGYVDKKIKGGLGIVADDVTAGIIANFILQIIYAKTSWLGSQLP